MTALEGEVRPPDLLPGPLPDLLPGLLARLRPGVRPVLRALLEDPRTRTVVLAGSRDSNPKTTVLVLPAGTAAPALALKVATTPAAAAAVRREAALLRELHRREVPVAAQVPRCLDVVERDGLPVLVATAVPGRSMAVDYHRWRHTSRPAAVTAELALAGRWLDRLQARTTGARRPVGGTACALAERAARRGPVPGGAVLGAVAEVRERLGGQQVAAAVVHGDFWCGNVLTSSGAVSGVVDWEHGEVSGEPLRDHVRFVLSHALYLDRHTRPGRPVRGHPGLRAGRPGDGVRHALLGHGWYPDLVQGFLRRALERHGVPDALWFAVALAGVAEVAATADHPQFAALHTELLLELAPYAAAGRR